MRIEKIHVENYRSAESVDLNSIGAFNVLIGKNNSGKSTILLAVEAFFKALRAERLVSLDSSFGRRVNFTGQNVDCEIILTLTFSLDATEREILIAEIANESPQLRTLLDSVEPIQALEVSVAIKHSAIAFAYVQGIRFAGRSASGGEAWRTVLKLSPAAARELAQRQVNIENSNRNAADFTKLVETFDADDFARLKRENGEGTSYPASYRLATRRLAFGMSPQSYELFEQLTRNADSYGDFKTAASAIKEQALAEAKKSTREPLQNLLETFSGDQASIPSYALHLLGRIASHNLLYLTERRDPVGRPEAKQLLEYKVTRGGPATLRDIQSKVEGLLGVKVDAFESASSGPNERTAEMDVDDFLLEVNGSGVKEALRLILDVELKKPTILLVEEPEVHLHPALEMNMMRYLRDVSASCQVFISTHSTNFLDTANTQNVYFVSKTSTSRSAVKLLNVGEAEGELPEALGIRLSSLFMYDRLLFVEGLSDELILREFATLLGLNLSQASLGFIHIGGSRNYGNYANEATFSFLSKRMVKSTFVLDRDEKPEEEIAKMRDQLANRATLHVLSRRELENYLIKPRPLSLLIQAKQSASGAQDVKPVTVELVTAEMLKAADSMRVFSIVKRTAKTLLNSIHVNMTPTPADTLQDFQTKLTAEVQRLKDELSKQEQLLAPTIQSQTKLVEANWKNGWSSMVPGDELLDKTCQAFGTRFRKTVDGPVLAKLYQADEIEPEITNLLRSVIS